MTLSGGSFRITRDDGTGFLTGIRHAGDKDGMNWIEGSCPWGKDSCSSRFVRRDDSGGNRYIDYYVNGLLETEVTRYFRGECFFEERRITNISPRKIVLAPQDFGIYAPFNDSYEAGGKCMTDRCHAHIWCGLSASYICALKMGGGEINLGMVLTRGELDSYSIERDESSNDRGDFILHPPATALDAEESFTLGWKLFWHKGREDFQRILASTPGFIGISSPRYTLFTGEKQKVDFTSDLPATVRIGINGRAAACESDGKSLIVAGDAEGFKRLSLLSSGRRTGACFFVSPPLPVLTEKRCRFICTKQQYHRPGHPLDGAYLTFDRETEDIVYSRERMDINSARERVGMGILVARQLQVKPDSLLRGSLDDYDSFIFREIFNADSGEVFNDLGRDNSFIRLYNYPWVALFLIEMFRLSGDRDMLTYLFRCLKRYYGEGGHKFYSIALPALRSCRLFDSSGMEAESAELQAMFRTHADYILGTGLNYPSHEVTFEQSIVAPAADYLLQQYRISGEKKYLLGAEQHMAVLDLFNGFQPDCRQNDIAVRHWDGYWFGKRKLYGDTFPHYWSVLTANVFNDYYSITGKEEYRNRAETIYRNNLCLFTPDGNASCAYIYPYSVNGRNGRYFDPYANDQDWALYFMMESGLFD